MQNELSNKYEHILKEKDFDLLYNTVNNELINKNNSKYTKGLNDYKKEITKLNFKSVNNELKLIEEENYSIFVPLDIIIKDNNFTHSEIEFLKENSKYNNENFINGKSVWELYVELIEKHSFDFLLQKSNIKNIQSIMSKFVFSIFSKSKDIDELRNSAKGEEKYGFFYLSEWKDVYKYESGLNVKNEYAIFL